MCIPHIRGEGQGAPVLAIAYDNGEVDMLVMESEASEEGCGYLAPCWMPYTSITTPTSHGHFGGKSTVSTVSTSVTTGNNSGMGHASVHSPLHQVVKGWGPTTPPSLTVVETVGILSSHLPSLYILIVIFTLSLTVVETVGFLL